MMSQSEAAGGRNIAAELRRTIVGRRSLTDRVLTLAAFAIALGSLMPLISLIGMLASKGFARLSLRLFLELPPAAGMVGGGIGNALVGTLVIVGIASLIAVPTGTLAAIWVAEFARPGRHLASGTLFAAKLLSGMPSILAGVFAYTAVVVTTGGFSAWAGGIALAVLMIPTVLLSGVEAIRSVPANLREAAYGMGTTPFQAVRKVVLPAAAPSLLTGIMLAIARASGETAPLLFTALSFDYWPSPRSASLRRPSRY